MIEPVSRQQHNSGYRERLRAPVWWYPVGAVVGVLLGAEFIFVIPDSLAWLPIVLSILGACAIVWRMSAATIAVVGAEIVVGDRRIAASAVDEAYALSYTELRRVVGRHGDPTAFNFIRSWVGPGVQLILHPAPPPDPEAEWTMPPEPYWLISTRHPDRFLAAISAAR